MVPSAKTLAMQTLAFVRETPASIVRLAKLREQTHDEGLEDLCHGPSESRDLLGSEATAGIEPAMKVLQTSALPLGYVA
jgi:hypothetical protein